MIKSVVLTDKQLDLGLDAIRTAEKEIRPWMNLVDKDDTIRHQNTLSADSIRNHGALMYLLQITRRNDILKWLSPEPYRKHHVQASEDVLPGTGQWLLSEPSFKKWKNESASSILWLHGIAGSGKSKLVYVLEVSSFEKMLVDISSSIVIEDALENFKAGNSPHPVYFYCSRNPTEPARSDPQAILASLARQLSSTQPGKPLLQPSIDLYDEEEAKGFVSGQPRLDESLKLIMQLIELYPQTTIVLDALDECNPATRLDLLRALEHLLQHSCSLLKGYLNLEIDSRRNSNDIAQFVNAEVERLIKDGKLLRNSKSRDDMREMIVRKVTKDAAEMFRWASMQLQYLCSFKFDIDIENSLGRLPPDLYTLYGDIYDVLSETPGGRGAMVFKNVLRWLLCARKRLKTEEFLAVVSVNPSDTADSDPIAQEDVLEICNNFVVFDNQLNTFRFAHLSVDGRNLSLVRIVRRRRGSNYGSFTSARAARQSCVDFF
ncbi:hypothetical protein G6514_009833 [Epicoccum nigrum]|nr:hypothetical protein G6514_009833 [Epicoccum nigrum]